ncbi:MAG: hypothetical protein N2572_01025 [Syntrophales bacterium]|nr:hypothetical protein [Syntrophales bacterium]
MKQFILTPAAGKRLIARAVASHQAITSALRQGTIVIVAGTTNGYCAEEILKSIGQGAEFSRQRFFRGIVLPPSRPRTEAGTLPDMSGFPGDVVIRQGVWEKGKTIFDVVDELKEGDVILKGANAIDGERRKAAILIGHPQGGTIMAALRAHIGRRVHLIIPVGLEKRILADPDEIARRLNASGLKGHRYLTVNGQIITEIEALEILTGARATLIAAGGVAGAEGAILLAVEGSREAEEKAEWIFSEIKDETPFTI